MNISITVYWILYLKNVCLVLALYILCLRSKRLVLLSVFDTFTNIALNLFLDTGCVN